MKEKLLCVLEKHAESLTKNIFMYDTYDLNIDDLNIDDLKITLGKGYDITTISEEKKFLFFVVKAREISKTSYYYIELRSPRINFRITQEEFDNILNLKKEKEEHLILEQLNKLC